MRCKICLRVRRLFPDDFCGMCYYSNQSRDLGSYMVEYDIIEGMDNEMFEYFKPTTKECNKCMKVKPRTNKHFYKNGSKYFRATCIECLKVTA